MNRMPRIGERVIYAGGTCVGPCVGVVRAIYPSHVPAPGHDEDDEDCQYIQGLFDPKHWHVSFEVEGNLPKPFVYNGNKFAPTISDIEPENSQRI